MISHTDKPPVDTGALQRAVGTGETSIGALAVAPGTPTTDDSIIALYPERDDIIGHMPR